MSDTFNLLCIWCVSQINHFESLNLCGDHRDMSASVAIMQICLPLWPSCRYVCHCGHLRDIHVCHCGHLRDIHVCHCGHLRDIHVCHCGHLRDIPATVDIIQICLPLWTSYRYAYHCGHHTDNMSATVAIIEMSDTVAIIEMSATVDIIQICLTLWPSYRYACHCGHNADMSATVAIKEICLPLLPS